MSYFYVASSHLAFGIPKSRRGFSAIYTGISGVISGNLKSHFKGKIGTIFNLTNPSNLDTEIPENRK